MKHDDFWQLSSNRVGAFRLTVGALVINALLSGRPLQAQTTATWTGSGVSGSYNDPDNWDILTVPVNNGTTYDVDLQTANVEFDVPEGAYSIDSLNSGGAFTIPSNRSLTVTNELRLSSGSLSATGSGAALALTGQWVATGQLTRARLLASAGGTIEYLTSPASFLMLPSSGSSIDDMIRATGVGSSINLPSLSSLTYFDNTQQFDRRVLADDFGQIDLSGLQAVSASGGSNSGLVFEVATGGTLDLSGLQGINTGPLSGGRVTMRVRVEDFDLPSLTTAHNLGLLVDSASSALTPSWDFMTRSTIMVEDTGLLDVGGNLAATSSTTVEVRDTGRIRVEDQLTIDSSSVLLGEGIVESHVISSGSVTPGSSAGLLTIDGDYTQNVDGKLGIELGGLLRGDEYDVLAVTGELQAAGALNVTLIGGFLPAAGDMFDILDFGSSSGDFDVNLPELSPGLSWDDSDLLPLGVLRVESSLAIPGDYDGDADVDGRDFLEWQRAFGTIVDPFGSGADGNGDGIVNAADLVVWRNHYGTSGVSELATTVPEPSSLAMLLFGSCYLICRKNSRSNQRLCSMLAAITTR